LHTEMLYLKLTLGAATKEAFESQSDVVQISVK